MVVHSQPQPLTKAHVACIILPRFVLLVQHSFSLFQTGLLKEKELTAEVKGEHWHGDWRHCMTDGAELDKVLFIELFV